MIVALPGLFSYLFFTSAKYIHIRNIYMLNITILFKLTRRSHRREKERMNEESTLREQTQHTLMLRNGLGIAVVV